MSAEECPRITDRKSLEQADACMWCYIRNKRCRWEEEQYGIARIRAYCEQR